MRNIIILALCVLGLAACADSPATTVNTVVTDANSAAATAGTYLPNACAVLAVAHSGFQVAEDLDPSIAANKAIELTVYTNLTTGTAICSPATIASPPANAAELIAVAYNSVRQFIPTLPGAPVTPAPAPAPAPEPAPQPVLQPVPQPVPQAVLQPAPQPVAQPVPQPAPAA